MDAESFLQSLPKFQPAPIFVLAGTEDYLKRKVSKSLRDVLLGEDKDMGTAIFDGEKTSFSQVREELTTVSFFGGQRVAWVDSAADFISKNRDALEKYLQTPSANGVLVLDTTSWPSNTRLAKILPKHALILCEAPTQRESLVTWCVHHAKENHKKKLPTDAANLLVDLIGPDLGRLDQEIAKLACYAIDLPSIECKHVDLLVGLGQVEKIWKVFDYLAQGKNPEAFGVLEELLLMGEEPIKILGAFASQLRKLAFAARMASQGKAMGFALEKAGVPPFGKASAEAQLRKIGKAKAGQILNWLVEADIGMKGGSFIEPSAILERLLAKLSGKGSA